MGACERKKKAKQDRNKIRTKKENKGGKTKLHKRIKMKERKIEILEQKLIILQ